MSNRLRSLVTSPLLPTALLLVLTATPACSGSSPKTSGTKTPVDPTGGTGDTGGDTPPPPGPAAPSICTVAKVGSAGVVISGTVLAPTGPLVGEVLIDGAGKIACVDASCSANAAYASATQIACPSGVISPGLINAHDHTDYNSRGPIVSTSRFTHRHGWRTGANGEKALDHVNSTKDAKVIAGSELRYVFGGATAVLSSGGAPGLLRNLAGSPSSQLEGLTGRTAYFDTFPLGDGGGKEISSGCGYPNIRSVTDAFKSGNYAPHIAEGINAAAQNEFACLTAGATSVVRENTSIIHAVGINARDVDVIQKAKAKVIWSPRSNIDLYGNTAPVTELKAAGVTVALGTDWLASGSMNMLRELSCADSLNSKYFHGAFNDRELFEMATKNAAVAAGFATQVGELAPGTMGDVTVFDGSSSKGYRAVLDAGVEHVRLVLRGGKVLFGDSDIVTAMSATVSPTCASVDVCGIEKHVCVDVPGMTLADIQASAVYPLFFCAKDTPKDEPTCTPFRDTYPNGTSATDRDGDGIADDADDCADVFNPPRPMDGTTQSDVDGDGVGDACDAAPLDSATH